VVGTAPLGPSERCEAVYEIHAVQNLCEASYLDFQLWPMWAESSVSGGLEIGGIT
jgi:hypothetical protein